MSQKPAIAINENQRRGISVGLGLLDETLCRIVQWIEGQEVRSSLYQEINDLAPGKKIEMLSLVKEMQGIIAELRDTLKLNQRVIEVSRRIQGHCSILWEQMWELESRSLKRYGDVPPGLADCLDPKIGDIVERVMKLSDLAHESEKQYKSLKTS